MIQGLQIELTSNELRTHLSRKAADHAKKADAYATQYLEVKKLQPAEGGMTNDPAQSLAMSRDMHAKKSNYYAFLAEKLIPNETYRLQEHDLERLEWFSRV